MSSLFSRRFIDCLKQFTCIAGGLVFFAQLASAQSATVPEQILKEQQNIILREQEQRRLEQERILGDQRQGNRPTSSTLELLSGKESACFNVQEIVLLGDLSEPVTELSSKLLSFKGACLGSVSLQNILRQITNYYIERGFVTTRAYLEPQDISAGRLEVLVVEGRVSDVVILEGDKRRSRTRQITGNRKDQILNIRDFEQGLDQVNRLGSKTAKIRIEPGDTIGSSRVFIDVQDSYTVDASAQVSNEGSKSTGRHQLSGSVSVEDALGFYENLTVTAKTSLDYLDRSLYSRSINGYVSVPWHYLTLSMSGSFQQYASELTSAAGSYAYNGDSWEARIGADYVAYRDKIKQVLFSTGLTLKESRNFITGRYIPASSKRLSVLDISGALSAQVLQGAGTVKLSFLKGIDAFAAHSDTIFSDNVPRGQFSKVELDASWRKNWQSTAGLMGFSVKGFASASPHTLVASERVGLGGPGSVRGFRDDSLSGDIGGYLQTEISWAPDTTSFPSVLQKALGRPQFYAALDGGRIAFDGDDRNEGGGMAGAAVGLRLSGGMLSGHFAYERPLYHPEFVSAPQRGFVRAQLRLSAKF